LPPEGQKKTAPTTASQSKEAANPEHAGIEEWKVITTASASYFNLGGHVDANGNIDQSLSARLTQPHGRRSQARRRSIHARSGAPLCLLTITTLF